MLCITPLSFSNSLTVTCGDNHVHLHLLTFLVIADRHPASKNLFLHLSPSLTILPSLPLPREPYKSPGQKRKLFSWLEMQLQRPWKIGWGRWSTRNVWKLSLNWLDFKLTWCLALLSFQEYIQHTFTPWNGKVIIVILSLFTHLNWLTE